MRRPGLRHWFGQRVTAVAAALVVAAVGFAPVGDVSAQTYPKKDRAQKNAPPPVKGQIQPRRNAMPGGVMPNRGGFRGQALGPNGMPNARTAPNVAPQGPNAGGANAAIPRANTFSRAPNLGPQGPNPNIKGVNVPGTRFGNTQGATGQPGARALGSNPGSAGN